VRSFVFVALALGVSGCGGCVDEGTEQNPQGTVDPSPATRPVGAAKVLPRIAHLPNSAAIRDSGSGDE
jgi:hypothetical protein